MEPYHHNFTKRLVKTPKLYFLDTGLCSYLTEWTSPQTVEAGAMSGALFETFVVGELLKSYWHRGRRAPFYFYRDKDKVEIDLLIVQDGKIYPIEIKKTASPRRAMVQSFNALQKLNQEIGPGALIGLGAERFPLTERVQALPVGLL